MIFPTWRYHRTRPACIVNDPLELEALGEDWRDRPFGPDEDVETSEASEDSEDNPEGAAPAGSHPPPAAKPKSKRGR